MDPPAQAGKSIGEMEGSSVQGTLSNYSVGQDESRYSHGYYTIRVSFVKENVSGLDGVG